jgi:putative ABC transport system ATP-binding protein
MSIILLNDITKIYGKDENKIVALDKVSLDIKNGEFVSIMGPSASGKSTLLNIIGCMDVPSQGDYILKGKPLKKIPINKLSDIRNKTISFVFQNFALMKDYSVYENIELPLTCRKMSFKEKKEKIFYYMSKLGIENLSKKRPLNISGGQQQRVAIARALVSDAEIILADEPTGALDQKTGNELLELFSEINNDGKTIIIVTHDLSVANVAHRNIEIKDGKVISDINQKAYAIGGSISGIVHN